MITIRHIQKLWGSGRQARLLEELIGLRIESLAAAELGHRPIVAAAAAALIRLEELNQPGAALASELIRSIVAHQEADGGWGDAAVSAMALRALALWNGQGLAIERGMQYLACLQQDNGLWPRIPIKRMESDPLISAFVLLQLGDNQQFRQCVDVEKAVGWFQDHACEAEPSAQVFWNHARPRSVVRSLGAGVRTN